MGLFKDMAKSIDEFERRHKVHPGAVPILGPAEVKQAAGSLSDYVVPPRITMEDVERRYACQQPGSATARTASQVQMDQLEEQHRRAVELSKTQQVLRPLMERLDDIDTELRYINKKLDTLQTAGFYLNED